MHRSNPDESRHQAGASLSGAILKDKLFYFLNVDITRRDFPMVDSLNTSGVVDPTGRVFVGCGAPASAAQCTAINALLPRFYGLVPRTASNDLYFAKVDYRLSERNTLSASLNYMRFVSPNGIQTGAVSTSGSGVNSNGDDSVRVRNGRFSWTAVPKSSFVNEFRFGWNTDRQADTFDDALLGQGLGFLQVSVAGAFLTPANYLPRVEPNEQRFQFADNATWTRGKHFVKFRGPISRARRITPTSSPTPTATSATRRSPSSRRTIPATPPAPRTGTPIRRPSATRWWTPPSRTTASIWKTNGASRRVSLSMWARATSTLSCPNPKSSIRLSADRPHTHREIEPGAPHRHRL